VVLQEFLAKHFRETTEPIGALQSFHLKKLVNLKRLEF